MKYKSKHFDKDKLAQKLDELVDDQINTDWSESAETKIGVMLGHAIIIKVSRDTEDVEDAEDTLENYPENNCII